MAVCDAKNKFLSIDFGGSGRRGDENVFNHSALGNKLKAGRHGIPPPGPVDSGEGDLPYFHIKPDRLQAKQGKGSGEKLFWDFVCQDSMKFKNWFRNFGEVRCTVLLISAQLSFNGRGVNSSKEP
ncbi:LOW QUALITY PROTEIN: hypothetical protein KUF71_011357 [Frankliniella fusca]|uniref:Uncharacterized protein n=1 Tax=Frankliniella fusca TaxID=407009 RepID=A0AAE1LVB3_9NEOP|nr:LOW QUALITY PROTEIN: hypothetical protein KUF71_011357 [Frankliniella fusca]